MNSWDKNENFEELCGCYEGGEEEAESRNSKRDKDSDRHTDKDTENPH